MGTHFITPNLQVVTRAGHSLSDPVRDGLTRASGIAITALDKTLRETKAAVSHLHQGGGGGCINPYLRNALCDHLRLSYDYFVYADGPNNRVYRPTQQPGHERLVYETLLRITWRLDRLLRELSQNLVLVDVAWANKRENRQYRRARDQYMAHEKGDRALNPAQLEGVNAVIHRLKGVTAGYLRGGKLVRRGVIGEAPGRIHIDFETLTDAGKENPIRSVATTIIHEASHKYLGTEDHAYESDKMYQLLFPKPVPEVHPNGVWEQQGQGRARKWVQIAKPAPVALDNADSVAHFAMDVGAHA